ncbi:MULTISPECIES: UbiX family flavin prenyltransferase [Paenibacillus]|uniref:Flavin prenyltransferase UbiX n=1 Tax=Paenibacillus naphthalenovorans TaxID=162209 RepID=A0A0U2W2A5_9BACL|nr:MULTISPECIES: flavin prenyltransferase UbiX [Paenibacillus]ALS22676.1 aromatic acid decarboxylase [Paenibacillus naphthalenovorans]NTZ17712.1 UbiX family flavin prenyltransferase [Paenibacillus sp. JMULE4]GCL70472.1 aromatic acid decarboxylase [Paenibacillus naphthalenovorans]SDH81207.1 4-hydroxy-3-polyprenylbenzoate decarboxylase [Paenibacillus naphthalenovorans]
MSRPWVIGITGASGAAYGVRLCRFLLSRGEHLHLVITDAGWRVLKEELGWDAGRRQESLKKHLGGSAGSYEYVPNQDIGAKTASGSFLTKGMVIVPCSMGTLSGIANGASDNLLERTADVMLKEGRKLILVPRETPLHAIHLENMLKLSRLGVRMIPAMPAFYQGPQTVDDMIDFVVGKILDTMEIEHQLYKRWGMQT